LGLGFRVAFDLVTSLGILGHLLASWGILLLGAGLGRFDVLLQIQAPLGVGPFGLSAWEGQLWASLVPMQAGTLPG
jgi:hypothetical protein